VHRLLSILWTRVRIQTETLNLSQFVATQKPAK
jgi:hypothetical protein